MDNLKALDKILMHKGIRGVDALNDIYYIRRELENYLIVKAYDTCTREDKNIFAIKKEMVDSSFYTAKEFLENSNYIGISGYYKNMTDFEKFVSKDLITVYKDDYNILMYDSIINYFFITYPYYPEQDFIPFNNQNTKVRFKKGLGRKSKK